MSDPSFTQLLDELQRTRESISRSMAGALTQGAGRGDTGAALAALRSEVSRLEADSAGVGNPAQLKSFQTSESKLRQCSSRLHRNDPDSTSIRADGDARVLAAVTSALVRDSSFREFSGGNTLAAGSHAQVNPRAGAALRMAGAPAHCTRADAAGARRRGRPRSSSKACACT